MQVFRNSPCWSESSLQLNCIINYSEGSELEANLKRGDEIEREQELDGGQLYNTPSWSWSHSLSLSVNEGWERGGAWVTSVSGCVTFLRREGVGGWFNELLKRTQTLVNSFQAGEPSCLALGPEVNDLVLHPGRGKD